MASSSSSQQIPKSLEDVHTPLDLTRFTRRFYRQLVLQAVVIGFAIAVVGYVVARYPALASNNEYLRARSRKTWDLVCADTSHRDPNVHCDQISDLAFMRVPVISIMEALRELVAMFHMDFNICATGSSCAYILTKTIDTFVTYSWLLAFTLLLCATYVYHVFRTTTVQYEKLQRKRRVLVMPAPSSMVRHQQHQFDVSDDNDDDAEHGTEMHPIAAGGGGSMRIELLDNDSRSAALFGMPMIHPHHQVHRRQQLPVPASFV